MKKEQGCTVVDETGDVLILNGDVLDFLSKDHNGPKTHVLIGYYKNFDDWFADNDKKITIYPISQCFFMDRLNS